MGTETNIQGIIQNIKIDGDHLKIILKNKEKIIANYYFETKEEKQYYEKKLKLGMTINLAGELIIPNKNTMPNTFNYQKYLYNHQIYYIFKTSNIEIINHNYSYFYKFKNFIRDRIYTFESKAYLLTFILGLKDEMDENNFEEYRVNGVTHLFALSGMHVTLFATVLLFLLKKLKCSEFKRYTIVILFLLIYLSLTNTPSILRAVLFFILLRLNQYFYTEIKTIYILIITFFIIIMIKPFNIYDLGFIYSFVTSSGLILANDILNKKDNYLISLFKVSFVAFLFSLPITLINFYEFNLMTIINNILIVPIVTIIVYPLSLLTFIFSFLDPILVCIIKYLELLNSFIYLFNLKIIMPKINITFIILYYLIIFIFLKKQNYKYFIFIILLLLLNKLFVYTNFNYQIYFLDVGQGDSILIRCPYNKKNILIDTGGKLEYFSESWQQKKQYHISDNTLIFLKSLGITKLDTIIATHGDEDHMGESINIIEKFKVKNVVFNVGDYNDLELKLIKILNKKNISYYQNINSLNVGIKLLFLNTKDYDNENDNSSVIYTEIDNIKLLFMGDAGVEKEKDIIEQYHLTNIDILKVGHHGSNTSSAKTFINNINPKNCIISVGTKNKYGHPNKSVLETLNNCNIYRTDINGSVKIELKNNKYKIKIYN